MEIVDVIKVIRKHYHLGSLVDLKALKSQQRIFVSSS